MKFYTIKETPCYELSRTGVLRNKINGKVLKGSPNQYGYICHGLRLGLPKRKWFALHLLLAKNFLPGYRPGLQVNHIDGVKLNNSLDNLEWVTVGENAQHRHDLGLQVSIKGSKHKNAKLTAKMVRKIRSMIKAGRAQNVVAAEFAISQSQISNIKRGKAWCHNER